MEPHSDFDLCSTKQMCLFLFSVPPIRCVWKEWRSAVSQLIELLDREGQYNLTYSPAASPSAKIVVLLEAAKRISFAVTVRATSLAEKVQKCLE